MKEHVIGKILVAEDNLITQKLIGSLLRHWGHCVSVVSNGREVLEKLKKQTFDVLILDYQMPQMDGFETIKAVNESQDEKIREMPIIFMTGEVNQDTLSQLESAKVKCFLKKPIQYDVLSQTLTHLLKRDKSSKKKRTAATKYLRKITNANNELMAELIDVFIDEAPNNFHKMKSYCLLEDWHNLKRIVHKIKANYQYVGIEEHEVLGDLEFDLERRSHPETYLAKIMALEEVTSQAIISLKKKKMMLLGKVQR